MATEVLFGSPEIISEFQANPESISGLNGNPEIFTALQANIETIVRLYGEPDISAGLFGNPKIEISLGFVKDTSDLLLSSDGSVMETESGSTITW